MGTTSVDCGAIRAAAQRFGAAADIIEGAARTNLAAFQFDGATAGRAHTARGEAVHAGLNRLAAVVIQWSRAAAEIAATLRADTDRYADAEFRSVARVK